MKTFFSSPNQNSNNPGGGAGTGIYGYRECHAGDLNYWVKRTQKNLNDRNSEMYIISCTELLFGVGLKISERETSLIGWSICTTGLFK